MSSRTASSELLAKILVRDVDDATGIDYVVGRIEDAALGKARAIFGGWRAGCSHPPAMTAGADTRNRRRIQDVAERAGRKHVDFAVIRISVDRNDLCRRRALADRPEAGTS